MRIVLAFICSITVAVIVPISYVSAVECPDKESYCPEGTTCCALDEKGPYGCCPLRNAVCCSDHLHCCPQDTVCHVDVGTCEQRNGLTTPMRRKSASSNRNHLISAPTVNRAKPLNLPDEFGDEMQPMEGDDTRYRNYHNRYAGDRSYDEESTQERIDQFMPAEKKLLSFKRVVGLSAADDDNDDSVGGGENDDGPVTCPDHRSQCPPRTTCCPLADGGATASYGCCPSPRAVCCDDHEHCCPHGSTCDTQAETCIHRNNGVRTRMLKKSKSIKLVRKPAVATRTAWLACAAATADDSRPAWASSEEEEEPTACPSGSTCCADEEGGALCCPHADGSCCAGSRECCPGGFHCLSTGRCYAFGVKSLDASAKVSFFSRISATPLKRFVAHTTVVAQRDDATICADGSACAPRSTCCAVANAITDAVESYRCCELSRAVCCGASADFCCPRGYKCASERRCERGQSFLDFVN